MSKLNLCFFFFQAEDGIRDYKVTGVQTCALPILSRVFPSVRGPLASEENRVPARRESLVAAHRTAHEAVRQARIGIHNQRIGLSLLIAHGLDQNSFKFVSATVLPSHYFLLPKRPFPDFRVQVQQLKRITAFRVCPVNHLATCSIRLHPYQAPRARDSKRSTERVVVEQTLQFSISSGNSPDQNRNPVLIRNEKGMAVRRPIRANANVSVQLLGNTYRRAASA